jgi:uncharacterized protein
MYNIKREFYSNLRNIENYKQVCRQEALYYQHGTTTVLKHSRNVAFCSLWLAKKLEEKFNIKFNYNDLIVGAFLHDMFLYDWHVKDKSHRLHGYIHPKIASINAKKICNVNDNVAKIINTHMWPLTLRKIPLSKEAFIVCIVDKYVALKETFKIAE